VLGGGVKNTGLDRTTLSLCVSLIENGVAPEALGVSFPAVSFCVFGKGEGLGLMGFF